MNIILLHPGDWTSASQVSLSDHRAAHLRRVLAVAPGDRVRVGLINSDAGIGTVLTVDGDAITLEVLLTQPHGARHPFDLVLALPRPKMLRRVLRTAAEFGVDNVHLIHSYRVEKSYWQSPLLAQPKIEDALLAGMERAADTRMPSVQLHHRFRPFIEDVLPSIAAGRRCLIAHPGSPARLRTGAAPGVILIGPEGGFIPFELELAAASGAEPVSIGERVLSVDTAVTTALALGAP